MWSIVVRAAAQPPLLRWKLIGSFAWHAAAVGVANVIFATIALPPNVGNLLRPSALATHILLYILQALSLLGHWAVLSSNEYAPVTYAKLGVHGRTWISLILTRVVVRGRTWSHAVSTLTFFGMNALSGVAYAALYGRLKLGPAATSTWSLWFGVLLSACYSSSYLIRGHDVLGYPPLQRHRWFRLKERIPSALLTAAWSTAVTSGLVLTLRQSLLLQPRLLYGWALAGLLCSLSWSLGAVLLQLVYTERLQLAAAGDSDPNTRLLTELAGSNTILQDLALMDLALTAEVQGGDAAWRRAAIFADESGRAAWSPLAAHMLGEVREFTSALAAALPSAAAEAAALARSGSGGTSSAAVRWNVLRMSPSTGLRVVSREQDLAAWNVRSKYYRITWCLRGLCGLAEAAQRGEDRYGVVLLCAPALPDIAVALLSAVLALNRYTRFLTATRPRYTSTLERAARSLGLVSTAPSGRVTNVSLQPAEEVAFALEAVARNAVSRLALVYGDKLRECISREARTKPAHGSITELTGLLSSMVG